MSLFPVVLALVIDAIIGDPDPIWRRWPHPVVLFGKVIDWLDQRLNQEDRDADHRRWAGILTLLILIAIAGFAGSLIQATLLFLPFGSLVLALLASVLIAQNSLYRHVAAVRDAFRSGGLAEARIAVSMIVGRDPESLDEAGVSRAAIESCAENFSDGVVAPVLWFALLGLPGLLIYKMINTADSMIGHRTPRHADFGWASAKVDDLVNWPAARLSILFIAAGAFSVGGRPEVCVRIARRDAGQHKSPNAGWPEAAFAAALGIALAGPRRYGGTVVDDPYMHPEGRREAGPDDIGRALRLLVAACLAQLGLYLALAVIF